MGAQTPVGIFAPEGTGFFGPGANGLNTRAGEDAFIKALGDGRVAGMGLPISSARTIKRMDSSAEFFIVLSPVR
ncbi:MAG: hypothetical protein ACI906_000754 [Candidatus Latescibacterota bacterium]|jgi:hypothetical protein